MNNSGATGFFFVLPLLLGVVCFMVVPAVTAVGLSFCRWSLTAAPEWVGGLNYQSLLGLNTLKPDPLFCQALFNTLVISLVVPFQVGGSFVLACFLNHRSGWRRFLRLVVFIPTLVSPIALYIMWRAMFNCDVGLLARLLMLVGIDSPLWLDDPAWSKPAVMLVLLWESVGGFQMLFFLAGLRQIPEQLHDMARLDGLGMGYRVRDIYWPWLKSLVGFNLCLGFLGAVQGGFEVAYIMTGGGPLRSTTTLSYFLFENSFQWQRLGVGAAVGMIMFLLVLPLIVVRGRRKTHG